MPRKNEDGEKTMTVKELYEWAKARNAEDMTLHVDTWNELFNELVVESNLAIAKLDSSTTAVIIRK